jgi:ABC-2 type transport system ATP-binding protein
MLALRDISRRWGRRPVLTGVSLSLDPGTIGWLGGPNGAGKTTLLRIAAGLLVPDAGSIVLNGLDPERDRRAYRRHVGFLSAGDRGLYARLTAVQNLEFWAGVALVPARERAGAIEAAVDRFELGELARRRVDRMSMGQRQRVRLAMTFLHCPTVALLDEPHTSLDDRGRGLLEAALAELSKRGGASLWCSPTVDDGPRQPSARHWLEDGRVVSE